MHHRLGTNVVSTFGRVFEPDLNPGTGQPMSARRCSRAPAGQGNRHAERDGGPEGQGLCLGPSWRRGAYGAEGEVGLAGRGSARPWNSDAPPDGGEVEERHERGPEGPVMHEEVRNAERPLVDGDGED